MLDTKITKLPSFSLTDELGETVTQDDLLGRYSVLYFYPKDNTPGCTKQACDFRDHLASFPSSILHIYGVSLDSKNSHQKFKEKYALNFTLLSDPEAKLSKALDVYKEKKLFGKKYMGIERSTFLIDPEGNIIWEERSVSIIGHLSRVLKAFKKISKIESP